MISLEFIGTMIETEYETMAGEALKVKSDPLFSLPYICIGDILYFYVRYLCFCISYLECLSFHSALYVNMDLSGNPVGSQQC